jgi:putative addiction module CopG family antidote
MAHYFTTEQEAIVERILATGEYADADEVVTQALLLLEERDRRRRWLRAELQIGIDQAERGELIEWTPQFMDDILREAVEGLEHGKPIRDAVEP